jgi:hypothetical protein
MCRPERQAQMILYFKNPLGNWLKLEKKKRAMV